MGIEESVVRQIDKFLNLDIIKQNKNAKFYHEYEFVIEDNKTLSHGIIDLLIETEKEFIIIDYKLKNIDDSKYREQLQGYRKTVQNVTNKNVSCYLYSIIGGILKKI